MPARCGRAYRPVEFFALYLVVPPARAAERHRAAYGYVKRQSRRTSYASNHDWKRPLILAFVIYHLST